LFRATLFCLSPDEYVLFLCCDHSVLDGWSVNVLLRELKVLYAAFLQGKSSPLPLPVLRYADFAAWQPNRLEKTGSDQLKFWQRALADAPRCLELPFDKLPPPISRHAGAKLQWAVPTSLWRGLKQLNEHEQVTMFMTVLAAFQLLLSRYSGQT